jgi:small subunit ribosomal protein S5
MAQRDKDTGLLEEVIAIRFHTKVTKGGRNLSVGVLVAVGDGKGKVGLGYGKARGVPAAIEKASKEARANMTRISLIGDTVAHEVWGSHGSARVLLKPASAGTGAKAGSAVRAILQVLGVHNVLTKIYGPTNPVNVAKATMNALRSLHSVAELEALRGVKLDISHPQARAQAAPEQIEPAQEPLAAEAQAEASTE